MSNIPADLRYTESHEWVRSESDGTLAVGLTDHAQQALGPVVFVELPEVGKPVAAGDVVGAVEAVTAQSDIHAPVGGEVIAVNEELCSKPHLINTGYWPHEAWIFKIRPSDSSELDHLLDAAGYKAAIGE
ncbi:glycine cleavage system protein GcvH [Streptomyces sp. NPDC058674]|uniref:glycine cleavage system protein GcvH n=1 Tax=Streptomyces sp. NPDC058674 TaxID=3346592 RepID=UPI00364E1A95